MIDVDIRRLVPAFILGDRNGYAAAKALETGLKMFCAVIQNGIDNAINVDKMPEWRLDEMAWELGCLYDYGADIENKRAWIRDAVPLYASYGTIEAVYLYLSGYFTDVEAEENWQYGGEPYHFRITVGGEWTDAKEQWAKRAVADTKNVRSVLDDLSIGSSAMIKIFGQTQWWRILYEMTTGDTLTGTIPQESTIGKIVEVLLSANTEAAGFRYPYELTGTIPQENMVSAQGSAMATAQSDGVGTVFSYPQTSGNTFCGENDL